MISLHAITVSPKAALLLSLLLTGVFAGCVDEGDADCVEGVCTQTAKPGDAFLTNATRPSASLNECWGIGLGTNVPPEAVEDELPDAFYAEGLVPETAQLQILGMECSQVVINGTTGNNLRIAYTSVDASPHKRDWQGTATSSYIFQYYANDDAVVAALVALGVPAVHADITVERTTGLMVDQESWNIQAADHGFAYSFLFGQGQDSATGATSHHVWTGTTEFSRYDLNITYQFTAMGGVSPSLVQMTGSSAPHRVTGTPQHPFYGQVWASRTEEWNPHPIKFEA